ncbi:winged helix-turn-helix domain-containing protein [Luteipulveratus sp. YIM 133132]|uniref:winged helix-turn-helix domain-containing protein n=1 Tax=Luteipulveratus flavus TaxID=3031728 RepID=UPI0023AEEC46|nr:winged helix-turn-helix domain-containing protein [Luteipulveratus sp. YIM 133132]MDE9363992.1 winged helix-turn-helix domain-containing protein [Luteipulveratus sp. YIM 133132]
MARTTTARYREIADDLTRRIVAGEWRIGDRLPSIADLQDHYEVGALNTIRSALGRLADEGLVRTTHGIGTFVTGLPVAGDATAELAEQLRLIERAAAQASRAAREVAAASQLRASTPPRRWARASTMVCQTCGEVLGGATRGWVDDDGVAAHAGDVVGSAHEEHHVVDLPGLLADAAESPGRVRPAEVREAWWERHAHLEEAARLLVRGQVQEAAACAHHAEHLSKQWPALSDLAITLGDNHDRTPTP